MSRNLLDSAHPPELDAYPEHVARAKSLPLRLHCEPDRDLEALTSDAAHQYKMQAKSRLHTLLTELRLIVGAVSGRKLARIWLGSSSREGTIRCWKDFRDHNRYPRREDLDRLASIVDSARLGRGGSAL